MDISWVDILSSYVFQDQSKLGLRSSSPCPRRGLHAIVQQARTKSAEAERRADAALSLNHWLLLTLGVAVAASAVAGVLGAPMGKAFERRDNS